MWLPPAAAPKLSKRDFDARVTALRVDLLERQRELRDADFPVLLVFAGVDGAGKHETVNLLNAWLDPRYLQTLAYGLPTQEEQERPEMWRYWRDLPARGHMGLVLSGWYSRPLLDRVHRLDSVDAYRERLDAVRAFEQMLTDDGALILKFWMHLTRTQQKRRLKALNSDPLTVWQVQSQDWEHLSLYRRFVAAAEILLDSTHAGTAPWEVIDGGDDRRRSLIVLERLHAALSRRLEHRPRPPRAGAYRPAAGDRLGRLEMGGRMPKKAYRRALREAQACVHLNQRAALTAGRATVLVFEGWDAAGKGGVIRRLTQALDARQYRVLPIGAPSDEELARHYLWRFWRHLPRDGHIRIFDRSWYGRVLVERVERLAANAQWQRAFAEINRFESELVRHGVLLLKFWLQLTPEEQLRRFHARQRSPHKRWKLTDEDWRNRKRWDAYTRAAEDMFARTDGPGAPWILIPADDKRAARVRVLEEVCRRGAGPARPARTD